MRSKLSMFSMLLCLVGLVGCNGGSPGREGMPQSHEIVMGQFSLKVENCHWSDTGDFMNPKPENGAFLVVELAMTNNADSAAAPMHPPVFELKDKTKGREYVGVRGNNFSTSFMANGGTLNPGATRRGTVTFDVPKQDYDLYCYASNISGWSMFKTSLLGIWQIQPTDSK